ncbi:hypothetical protein [Taibaiella koreensis]|uniref:hypothetical protein n=1 Tax=Taibaiella koreensis TaxID=1268548 RepID=UPI000E599392|nr:hypothetical protein [Taibaiella koreensis]
MKELESLQQKLEQLLKRHTALAGEKDRLEQLCDRHAGTISEQQDKITALETELRLKSVALSTAGTHAYKDKQQLKSHLERVIREIEKNIELL